MRGGAADVDKASAYATLHECLVTISKLIAPFMPFLAERLYRNLVHGAEGSLLPGQPVSVHMAEYPRVARAELDTRLIAEMERVRKLTEDGLAARERSRLKVRQPLNGARILGAALSSDLEEILRDELNVKQITYGKVVGAFESVEIDTVITEDLRREGVVREVCRKVNDLRKTADFALNDKITLFVAGDDLLMTAVSESRDHILAEVLGAGLELHREDLDHVWEGTFGDVACWLGIR